MTGLRGVLGQSHVDLDINNREKAGRLALKARGPT